MDDERDEPLDAAEMLALVERQQRDVQRRMGALAPGILLAWGISWAVGFSCLWLIDGMRPAFGVPLWFAVITFIVLQVTALAVSAVLGIRMGRGIRSTPQSAFTGTTFGVTWPIGFVGIYGLGNALARGGMPLDLLNIYYPTASVLFVGVMYLLAGGIWHSKVSIGMGVWMIVLAAVAPQFGYPTHYLIFAIAGGGVFLIAALVGFVVGRDPTGWGGWAR